MLELNLKKPPFDKKEVRQAINFATPYQEILDKVYQKRARQMDSPIPFIYPGYAKQRAYPTDYARAKELLTAAGLPDGFETTISFDAARTDQEQIAVLLRSSLAKVGVRAQIAKLPSASYTNALNKRKLEMFFWQDMPIQPDPGYALYLYYHGDSFTAYSNYNNPRVNKLIDGATNTYDGPQRQAMLDEAQRLIWDDAPHVWIAWPGWHLAAKKEIGGIGWHTANHVRFETIGRKA
jgi:peptide/nickel transport system substrate-binding protein